MWATLSVSRWMFLLTLAVVMLFSASEVDSHVPIIGLTCYTNVSSRKIKIIKQCYEQIPREDCEHHAFLILNKNNKWWSINPAAQWLQDKIKNGEIECPPDVVFA